MPSSVAESPGTSFKLHVYILPFLPSFSDGSVKRNVTDRSGLCVESVQAEEALRTMDVNEHRVLPPVRQLRYSAAAVAGYKGGSRRAPVQV